MLFYLIRKTNTNLFLVIEKGSNALLPQCEGQWPTAGEPKELLDALAPDAKTTYVGGLFFKAVPFLCYLTETTQDPAVPHKWVESKHLSKDNPFVQDFLQLLEEHKTVDGRHQVLSRLMTNGPMCVSQFEIELEASNVTTRNFLDSMVDQGWLVKKSLKVGVSAGRPANYYLPSPTAFAFATDPAFETGLMPSTTAAEYVGA